MINKIPELILSLLALGVSIYTLLLMERRSKTNQEIEMSRPLYAEHLIIKLPRAFAEYQNTKDAIRANEVFSRRLLRFYIDVQYFKYAHPDIYQKITQSISKIDYAISQKIEHHRYQKATSEINQAFNEIYITFLHDLPNDHIDTIFKRKSR